MIEFKELFKSGVHFGHRTSRWAPQMAPYIWGTKNKIHLIDISKTSILLNRAKQFLREVGKKDEQQILFVGTKKAAQSIIRKVAATTDMPYVVNRWIGGTLSNNDQIKKAITRLLHLRDVVEKSTSYHTKKELSMLKKEIARLEKNIGGIMDFAHPPAALIVVDAKREHAAIREALKLGIPVIAMVDTNTDPETINFVIPSNDDSVRSIECIINHLVTAFQEGKAEAAKLKPKKEDSKKEAKTIAKEKNAEIKEKDAVAISDTAERTGEKVTKKEAAEAVKTPVKEKAKPVPSKVEAKPTVKKAEKAKVEPKKETKSAAPKKAKDVAMPKAEDKKAAKPVAKSVEKKETKPADKKPAVKKTTEVAPKKPVAKKKK